MQTLYIDNDTTIAISNLKDSSENVFLGAATVKFQLKDIDGENVGTELTLQAVEGEDGEYFAVLQSDFADLTADTQYLGEITVESPTVVSGVNLDAKWAIDFMAKVRKFDG
jgi:hypothetical protein